MGKRKRPSGDTTPGGRSRVKGKSGNKPWNVRGPDGRFVSRRSFEAQARARYGPKGRAWTDAEKRDVARKVSRALREANKSGRPHAVVRESAKARKARATKDLLDATFTSGNVRKFINRRLKEFLNVDTFTPFVRINLGGLEFRARAVPENIERGIAGLIAGDAIARGGRITSGIRAQISEIVNKGTELVFKEFAPDFGPSLESLIITPEI